MRRAVRGLRLVGWIACTLGLAAVALAITIGGLGTSRVLSGSMAPAIRAGDVVVTRPMALSGLSAGDIPVLMDAGRGNSLIAHRIISVRSTGKGYAVITKGDANPAADEGPLIVTSDPVPVVLAVIPMGFLPALDGRLLVGGMIALVAVALGSTVLSLVRTDPERAGIPQNIGAPASIRSSSDPHTGRLV